MGASLRGSKIKVFPFAFRQITEGVGSEAGAMEGLNVVALASEHATDLMVAAFGEGEGGGAWAVDFEVGGEARFGFAAEHEVAAGEGFDQSWIEVFVDCDLVGFCEIGFGGGVAVDEWTLVGNEDKACGVFVETTDGSNNGFAVEPGFREEFVDIGAFCFAMGATVVEGFVKHDEEAVGVVEGLTIDGDGGGVSFLIGTSGGDAVDVNASFADPGGGLAAGAVAEG